jgi:hypothetical protein
MASVAVRRERADSVSAGQTYVVGATGFEPCDLFRVRDLPGIAATCGGWGSVPGDLGR